MHSPNHSRPQSTKSTIIEQGVQDRISQLSNKITNLHITKQDSSKKYEQIELMCEQIESKLQDFSNFVEEKLIDVRHKASKINKQVKKDYTVIDNLLKQQISNANQRMMLVVDQELDVQKQTNLRILKYIQHQINLMREQIDRQGHQRDQQARAIEESLTNDISQITKALDQACAECRDRVQSSQNVLFSRTENLSQKLKEIANTYSDNQAQFYKMLRDLVKKVKSELQDHQIKREETEAQILNLIDKLCDKTIQQKKI